MANIASFLNRKTGLNKGRDGTRGVDEGNMDELTLTVLRDNVTNSVILKDIKKKELSLSFSKKDSFNNAAFLAYDGIPDSGNIQKASNQLHSIQGTNTLSFINIDRDNIERVKPAANAAPAAPAANAAPAEVVAAATSVYTAISGVPDQNTADSDAANAAGGAAPPAPVNAQDAVDAVVAAADAAVGAVGAGADADAADAANAVADAVVAAANAAAAAAAGGAAPTYDDVRNAAIAEAKRILNAPPYNQAILGGKKMRMKRKTSKRKGGKRRKTARTF